MRVLVAILFVAVINISFSAHAQHKCSENSRLRAAQKTSVASPEEYDYDIKGLEFDINLTNTSTDISGSVITYATTRISSFGIYAFELNSALIIDSVKVNGQLNTGLTTTGSARKVTLPVSLANGTDFTVQVFYHGTSPAGNGQFFTGGLNHVLLPSGTNLMYSLSDDLFTDDWWPCKQSLGDKIDSVAMFITVDDTLKACSNGLLTATTSLPGNKLRYEWHTKYPIEYYLIAVAVAPYSEYSYQMHFTDGTNDSMLVQNFYYDSATFFTPARKTLLDSTGYMIDYFSKLYSRYPFDNEKYGHCMTILSGGMEHQTMTFMSTNNISPTLIAHELGHQWWGNSVTYGKWEDIWLSEGMATYTEQLYLEHFWGPAVAKTSRSAVFNQVMSQPGGSVWVSDTTNVNRIFDGRLTYSKGAAVAHMLRYLAPQDSLFFAGLRSYQQQFKYGTAVTADMQAVMQLSYKVSLDSFFRQWIYGEGYPTYSVKWEQGNNVVHLKLTQTTSHNSVKLFNIPLEIRLNAVGSDTVITINVEDTVRHHIFVWDKTMTGLTIDPNDHIVNRTGIIQRDASLLSVQSGLYDNVKIYPNPAKNGWHIENTFPGNTIQLYDISGKLIWTGVTLNSNYIPADNLPQGMYILQLSSPGYGIRHYKLLK